MQEKTMEDVALKPETVPLSLFLKKQTEEEHRKTENSPIMLSIMGDPFSVADYQVLLKRMLSFYLPIEKKINAFLENGTLSYSYSPKSPLLQTDLAYLCAKDVKEQRKESDTPALETHENFLGILYVLEGSTLGGALIHKMLEKHMDVSKAATFFYPYGKETKKRWDETRAFLNDCDNTVAINHNRVCDTAIATFQSIRRALNDESIT